MCTISSCLCCYRTLVCTMQCHTASNAHYAVLRSFQCVLLSFLYIINRICIIFRPYISYFYSIVTYLDHQSSSFYFYKLKSLKYHNFLNTYPIETKQKPLESKKIALLYNYHLYHSILNIPAVPVCVALLSFFLHASGNCVPALGFSESLRPPKRQMYPPKPHTASLKASKS